MDRSKEESFPSLLARLRAKRQEIDKRPAQAGRKLTTRKRRPSKRMPSIARNWSKKAA